MSLISTSLFSLLSLILFSEFEISVSEYEDEFKGCYLGIRNRFRYGPGLLGYADTDNIYYIDECRSTCIYWHDNTFYDDIHSCWQMNGWLTEQPSQIYYGLQTDYKTLNSGYCFCEYDEDLTIGYSSTKRSGPCELNDEAVDWINPVYKVNQQSIHNGDISTCSDNKVSAAAMCYQGVNYIKTVETGDASAIDHYYTPITNSDPEYLDNIQLNKWITNNNIELLMSNIYNKPMNGKWGLCDSNFDTICINIKYVNERFGCWMADCFHTAKTFRKSLNNGVYYEINEPYYFKSFRFYGKEFDKNEYIWEIEDQPPSFKTIKYYKYCRTTSNVPTQCNTFIKVTDENEVYQTIITVGECENEFYETVEN